MKIAWKVLLTGSVGVAAVAFTAFGTRPPRLIWNASASVPIGLYRVQSDARPELTDLVVVRPPRPSPGSSPKAATCHATCRC